MQKRQIEFYVRNAELSDLDSIQKIYQSARDFMKANGNSTQWGNDRPHKENIESNISKKIQFIYCYKNENGTEEVAGTFLFMHEKEPSYDDLKDGKWPENTEDYWCIHSVASGMKVKGVASFIFSWCENQPGVKCIKIDTHRNNLPMQHLVEKNGYIYCGHCYYYEDVETDDGIVQDFERIAFCKVLKK